MTATATTLATKDTKDTKNTKNRQNGNGEKRCYDNYNDNNSDTKINQGHKGKQRQRRAVVKSQIANPKSIVSFSGRRYVGPLPDAVGIVVLLVDLIRASV